MRPTMFVEKVVRALEKFGAHPKPERFGRAVGVVLVGYNPSDMVETIELIVDRLSPKRGFPSLEMVVVANSPDAYAVAQPMRGVRVIRGSNRDFEFSGYREGLAALEGADVGAIVLANDRLSVYSQPALQCLEPGVARLLATTRTVVGQLDGRTSPYTLTGRSFDSWIRSNFLFFSGSLRNEVVPDLDPELVDDLIPPDWNGIDWMQSSTLEREYAEMLMDWLTLERPQGPTWPEAEVFREAYWPTFRRKAGNILHEHLMSLRLVEQRVTVLGTRRALVVALLPHRMGARVCARLAGAHVGEDVGLFSRAGQALIAIVVGRFSRRLCH